jgi:hypothetical protein
VLASLGARSWTEAEASSAPAPEAAGPASALGAQSAVGPASALSPAHVARPSSPPDPPCAAGFSVRTLALACRGQLQTKEGPIFAPSRALDYEVEMVRCALFSMLRLCTHVYNLGIILHRTTRP